METLKKIDKYNFRKLTRLVPSTQFNFGQSHMIFSPFVIKNSGYFKSI